MFARSMILRTAALKPVERTVRRSRLFRPLVSRFIAGDTLDDAIRASEMLLAKNLRVTLDYLGENTHREEEAQAAKETYVRMLDRIALVPQVASYDPSKGKEPLNISIKLTQFGLGISTELCKDNVHPLVARAKELGSRVEIDMEQSSFVDRTLEIVGLMHARYGHVRSVIQAYLHRSEKDVECLNKEGIPIRLCKGAYKEKPDVAIQKKSEVDRNYVRLVDMMLASGVYPAVATHDPNMVSEALRSVKANGIKAESFEFQMLYGIRRDLQRRLVADGYRLRLYVPFGDAWYPYFMRRLAERPANLMFLMRNLFRK